MHESLGMVDSFLLYMFLFLYRAVLLLISFLSSVMVLLVFFLFH